MKCFYHADHDGEAAAFCVYAWTGLHGSGPVSYIPMDYNKSIRDYDIQDNEQVWIVDFSIPTADMDWLLGKTRDVTWIDHHKSAIEKYDQYPHKIRGVRRNGEAGCVLTYKYLHWYTSRGDGVEYLDRELSAVSKVPKIIELIGDRDIWAFRYGEETRNLCAALQCHDTSPTAGFWWRCLDVDLDPAVSEGNHSAWVKAREFWLILTNQGIAIRKSLEFKTIKMVERYGWETEFEGHKAFAMNAPMVGSEALGGDAQMDKYPLLIRYEHKGLHFTVSLYSRTVDCSEICSRHGGGGHKGAAGFTCTGLPFVPVTLN